MKEIPLNELQENLLPDFPDYHITRDGKLFSRKNLCHPPVSWRELKGELTVGGRRQNLQNSNKKLTTLYFREIVSLAYLGEIPKDHFISHKNNNLDDCRVENLTYLPIPHPLDSMDENLLPKYEGYHATKDGRIFSKKKIALFGQPRSWKELSPCLSRSGYKRVMITSGKGKSLTAEVHTLVALAHLGERTRGMDICHCDGNKLNNNIENLRYDTHKANCEDTVKHGLSLKGELAKASKLTNDQVKEISYRANVLNQRFTCLAEEYGVSPSVIMNACRNKSWTHVEKEPYKENTARRRSHRKFTEQDVIKVFKLRKMKKTQIEISKETGMSRVNVSKILKREFWAWVEIPTEFLP